MELNSETWGGDGEADVLDDHDADLDVILDLLREARGCDLRCYPRGPLARCLVRRAEAVGSDTLADYAQYLSSHPAELPRLFDAILVRPTTFFRDPATWAALAQRVGHMLSESPERRFRVWSAGCASGEEAYSAVMLFAELLGLDECLERVRFFATDIDEGALVQGRRATFARTATAAVPKSLAHRYLFRRNAEHVFDERLRRAIVFGRHDLVDDPPLTEIDLVLCRNTLMYMNPVAQARVLRKLHLALVDDGLLVVGAAEAFMSTNGLFTETEGDAPIFERASQPWTKAGDLPLMTMARSPSLLALAFDRADDARVLLDAERRVVAINRRAGDLLSWSAADVGRSFDELATESGLRVLAERIGELGDERAAIRISEGTGSFDVVITPLRADEGGLRGLDVSFARKR